MLFQTSSAGEPYYPLPPPFAHLRLTPLRPSTDIQHFMRLLNDMRVTPYMTAPYPFELANAERLMERLKGPADQAWANIGPLAVQGKEDWKVGTCPVRVIREVDSETGLGEETFVGDIFFGKNSFYEIEDAGERKRLGAENEAKELGDPSIVWSFGCASRIVELSTEEYRDSSSLGPQTCSTLRITPEE
jgi:hypothetical protein